MDEYRTLREVTFPARECEAFIRRLATGSTKRKSTLVKRAKSRSGKASGNRCQTFSTYTYPYPSRGYVLRVSSPSGLEGAMRKALALSNLAGS